MEFITLPTAKKHLNIEPEFTDDDEYIESLIESAQIVVEKDICRPLRELVEETDAGGTLPAPLRQAMLLLIGTYYASRENFAFGVAVNEIPAYKHLIGLYRNYAG